MAAMAMTEQDLRRQIASRTTPDFPEPARFNVDTPPQSTDTLYLATISGRIHKGNYVNGEVLFAPLEKMSYVDFCSSPYNLMQGYLARNYDGVEEKANPYVRDDVKNKTIKLFESFNKSQINQAASTLLGMSTTPIPPDFYFAPVPPSKPGGRRKTRKGKSRRRKTRK